MLPTTASVRRRRTLGQSLVAVVAVVSYVRDVVELQAHRLGHALDLAVRAVAAGLAVDADGARLPLSSAPRADEWRTMKSRPTIERSSGAPLFLLRRERARLRHRHRDGRHVGRHALHHRHAATHRHALRDAFGEGSRAAAASGSRGRAAAPGRSGERSSSAIARSALSFHSMCSKSAPDAQAGNRIALIGSTSTSPVSQL